MMETTNKKEIRTTDPEMAEIRAITDSRTIEGYGIVFNKESRNLGGFTEIILPQAIDGVIEKSDIKVTINHDKTRGILARSIGGKGSLKLSIDSIGVKYRFDAPKFDLGNELIEGVQRGDIVGSSFAFTVAKGGDSVIRRDNGIYLRTIKQFDEILDMSPCFDGVAYEDTTIALRNLDAVKLIDDGKIEIVAKTTDITDTINDDVQQQLKQSNELYKLKNK